MADVQRLLLLLAMLQSWPLLLEQRSAGTLLLLMTALMPGVFLRPDTDITNSKVFRAGYSLAFRLVVVVGVIFGVVVAVTVEHEAKELSQI